METLLWAIVILFLIGPALQIAELLLLLLFALQAKHEELVARCPQWSLQQEVRYFDDLRAQDRAQAKRERELTAVKS